MERVGTIKFGWVTLPAGAIIRVVAGPNGEGDWMVDVRRAGRPFVMFVIGHLVGAG